MNVISLEFKKCCQCSARATRKIELVEVDEQGVTGATLVKHFCGDHGEPLDRDQLALLVDARDTEIERLTAENERLRATFGRLMVCGNHIATHHKPNWPAYRLDGLSRDQQCEHALRTLGATQDYDMWVCWSGMMQERDALNQQLTQEKED